MYVYLETSMEEVAFWGDCPSWKTSKSERWSICFYESHVADEKPNSEKSLAQGSLAGKQ